MASSIRPTWLRTILGRRDDELAGDRVALLRHGGGGAAPLHERLEGLRHLGLHEQHDVGGDLGERAGDEAEEGDGLGEAVAGHVPGRSGAAEAQLVHQGVVHGEALVAERGQRAGGAGELADQDAGAQLGKALAVAADMASQTAAL